MELSQATELVKNKITQLNIDLLQISLYNKRYLKHYQRNLDYYMDAYAQLLKKALSKLNAPINQAVFLDYGGGCGLLSYLAINLGFNKVVYNDLYETSANDAKVISQALQLKVDKFIVGDIKQVTAVLNASHLFPNLICSFDVLEHIYDLKEWFTQLCDFKHSFALCFASSANGSNPIINRRLKKLHIQAELYERKKDEGWKEIDLHTSFLNERKKIILRHFKCSDAQANKLAVLTRGLKEDALRKEVSYFMKHGKMDCQITHPTNTCDPYTGNWTEQIIDTKSLCDFVRSLGFTCSVSNSFYPYSKKRILNLPKYLLNLTIRSTAKSNLYFSPFYTIEIEHKQ